MTKKKTKKVIRIPAENRERFLKDMHLSKSTWYRWAWLGSYGDLAETIRLAALNPMYGGWIESVACNKPRTK